MKKMNVGLGDEITKTIAQLIIAAPAFCVFNGIRIEANVGDKVSTILGKWEAAVAKRREEYEASDEHKEWEHRSALKVASLNEVIINAVDALPHLDLDDLGQVLAWIDSIVDATNHTGVDMSKLQPAMVAAFEAHGFTKSMFVGDAFDGDDRDIYAKWLIGQAMSFLMNPPCAIHDMWHGAYETWKEKFQ